MSSDAHQASAGGVMFSVFFMPVGYISFATKAWRNNGGVAEIRPICPKAATWWNRRALNVLFRQERQRDPFGMTLAVGWDDRARRLVDHQGTRMPQKRAFQKALSRRII
ncbi:hypothetical protein [Sulfitobacter sp. EhC04]|uniref:hypothetical protein n=1 Tax=Sulfitobacter sp. EhC04 TaxID=1849168 RepID=UPI0010FF603B|nr:hypothetical protein [Sulfitobacter sp. EhC04]